jgi:preprotein translocase subunit SecB
VFSQKRGYSMRLAPLQLKKYFITHLKVVAQRQYDSKNPQLYDFKELQNATNIRKNKENPNIFQISLVLKQIVKPKANLPYSFDTQIVGIFEVLPDWPRNRVDELVQINGPAMLYSAAREILAQVTGRGPWGTITLPSVNFIPLNNKKNAEDQESNK